MQNGELTPQVETEPKAAQDIFGDRIQQARQFAGALVEHGETLGLLGPLELPRLWSRHLINSALLASLLKPKAKVADVGSGAGFPGILLAILRPDCELVLIEPMERRSKWLVDQAAELGLDNVVVSRSRAEEYPAKASFDQVTARAVSALAKLIPITTPLLKPGGELIFLKGDRVQLELDAAEKQIKKYRLTNPEIIVLGEDFGVEITRVFRAGLAS